MESNESLLGKHIGNYIITKAISEGSFGSVYLAHHIFFKKRIVALKLLHLHLVANERDSFIREAELLETLRHRYILPIIDMGFDDGRPYLVTDYASGGSLRQCINQVAPRLLDQDQVLTILMQIGEALHYAHQQSVVHRDLKPENILFNAQGEALLADFGLATVLSSMSVKLTTAMGTPAYMAPEQFKGEISQECDQYALGCIAYELFTGQRLFSAPDFYVWAYKHMNELPIPLRQVSPHIPLSVEQAILKALAKDRKERHADVSTFLAALLQTKEQMLSRNSEVSHMRTRDEMRDAVIARKVADELTWKIMYWYRSTTRPALGKYLCGMVASLIIFLAGGWLSLAPFALGYQPYGADWVSQTKNDLVVGIFVAVVALLAFALFFASLLGSLRAAGVIAARKRPEA